MDIKKQQKSLSICYHCGLLEGSRLSLIDTIAIHKPHFQSHSFHTTSYHISSFYPGDNLNLYSKKKNYSIHFHLFVPNFFHEAIQCNELNEAMKSEMDFLEGPRELEFGLYVYFSKENNMLVVNGYIPLNTSIQH